MVGHTMVSNTIFKVIKLLMEYKIGSYLSLNEITSSNLMMNFITISYLFNCIFEYII